MRISDWSSDVCSSDLLGLGADETNADFGAGFGESGVFGQETVTRMDRIAASFDCNTDDVRDVEVGGDRLLAAADPIAFVRLEPVQREAVFVCVDRDCEKHGSAHV